MGACTGRDGIAVTFRRIASVPGGKPIRHRSFTDKVFTHGA